MKTSVILFVVACGVVAGAIVYLNRQKAPNHPAPVAETPAQTSEPTRPETSLAAAQDPSPAPSANTNAPVQVAAAAPAASDVKTNDSGNALAKTVDALLAARGGKHEMLLQLAKSGQLDDVIAELQKRAKDNPTDPEIPTTLGEALLNKVRALHEAGDTDINEMGILAMQADQSFNNALKMDPNNWEAQFVKYSSMFYWPADGQRDAQTAQHLASLIDQQDTMPPNPAFVQTYLILGNQYQKMGKMDEALATWQLGLQKFPGDATLQQKIADAAK